MKFKVGQKVCMVGNVGDAHVGDMGIIRALPNKYPMYAVEFSCFKRTSNGHDCDGLVPSGNGHWISENQMEPFTSFQEKFDRFMKERVGFLVKSKEIADELVKVFEKKGMRGKCESSPKDIMNLCLMDLCLFVNGSSSIPFISYNYTKGAQGLSYGLSDSSGKNLDELLDVTLDEIKEYLELSSQDSSKITQVTIIGEPKNPCVIKMRAKVTKNENGYTIEKLAEPKFTVGEQFATASGNLGRVTKVNPEGNYCVQWFNGKYCSAQPEDTMHKIVWDN